MCFCACRWKWCTLWTCVASPCCRPSGCSCDRCSPSNRNLHAEKGRSVGYADHHKTVPGSAERAWYVSCQWRHATPAARTKFGPNPNQTTSTQAPAKCLDLVRVKAQVLGVRGMLRVVALHAQADVCVDHDVSGLDGSALEQPLHDLGIGIRNEDNVAQGFGVLATVFPTLATDAKNCGRAARKLNESKESKDNNACNWARGLLSSCGFVGAAGAHGCACGLPFGSATCEATAFSLVSKLLIMESMSCAVESCTGAEQLCV